MGALSKLLALTISSTWVLTLLVACFRSFPFKISRLGRIRDQFFERTVDGQYLTSHREGKTMLMTFILWLKTTQIGTAKSSLSTRRFVKMEEGSLQKKISMPKELKGCLNTSSSRSITAHSI